MIKLIQSTFLLAAICSILSVDLNAQVDQTALLEDIQRQTAEGQNTQISLWFPTSYWEIALGGVQDVTPEAIEVIEQWFSPYVVIMAGNITIGAEGVVTFTDEQSMRKQLTVTDHTGATHKVVDNTKLDQELRELLMEMQPMFASMFGQLGGGLRLYLFEVNDKKGKPLLHEKKEGSFSVTYEGIEHTWSLPLPSMVRSKVCPVDNEKMNGTWEYCPYHGEKLKKG